MRPHPGELLCEIGREIIAALPDKRVSVPRETNWKECIDIVSASLGDENQSTFTTSARSQEQKDRLREIALRNVQCDASSSKNSWDHDASMKDMKPIRTEYNADMIPSPPRASKKKQEQLKKK